jgi:hypothetical protein
MYSLSLFCPFYISFFPSQEIVLNTQFSYRLVLKDQWKELDIFVITMLNVQYMKLLSTWSPDRNDGLMANLKTLHIFFFFLYGLPFN